MKTQTRRDKPANQTHHLLKEASRVLDSARDLLNYLDHLVTQSHYFPETRKLNRTSISRTIDTVVQLEHELETMCAESETNYGVHLYLLDCVNDMRDLINEHNQVLVDLD